jgi:acyl-coenzyme A synthetase/AMP-(fatty) acid ligase
MNQESLPANLAIPFASIRSVLRKYRDRDPDKLALVDLDQDTSITYGELDEVVGRVARHLRSLGLKAGDKIALLSDERLEKLILWLGIWRLGAVVCPLNVEINKTYISEILGNIEPSLALWHEDLDGAALTAGLACPAIRFSRWSPDGEERSDSDEYFAQLARLPDGGEVDFDNGPHDMAAIFCTSGTTSKPKCVVYNHLSYWLSGLSTLDMLGLTEDDKTLEYRSFGWNSAQVLSLMPWLETGLTLHIANRFSHSRFFEWIKKHEITFAAGVPTVVNMLLNEPLGVTAEDVPSLRLMTCSTAPLSPDQWAKFEQMYGVTLLQLYGMSEAGWICGNRHYRRRMGTVGPPAKHQDFRIVDGDGNQCPPGVEGEVTVGGPQTCLGTISPEGVFEDLSEARIPTGDLAVMDEDGFVTVTGRTKDLIIRGGVNIAPLEIDNVLLSDSRVLEAAAIGVPDAIYGEEIACYVVVKPGETLGEDDVRGHCAATLAAFKVPKMVYFIDDLPKSDRGKIRRDDLKELWARTHASS